jgi:hypothetical protein
MLDVGLEHVGYHVRVLRELGCIELVRTARRRGAIEHFYRAVERPYLTDREWKPLSRVVVKFSDGGTLEGTVQRDGTISVDAHTPRGRSRDGSSACSRRRNPGDRPDQGPPST